MNMNKLRTQQMTTRLVRKKLAVELQTKAFENGKIRVEPKRVAVKIWDLTNAGKRGKTVDILIPYDIHRLNDDGKAMVVDFTSKLRRADFTKAEQLTKKLLKDLDSISQGDIVQIQRFKEKGIRVDPSKSKSKSSKPIKIRTSKIDMDIEPNNFVIRDLTDMDNRPTLIPRRRKATSTKKMYAWVKANKSKSQWMSFSRIMDVMEDLGVDYHYYLARD